MKGTCGFFFPIRTRLMAMDGSNFEVPDEPDNITAFGYPGSRTGVAGGKLRAYLTSLLTSQ